MSDYKLNHPLYPNQRVLEIYKENDYPYRENTLDNLYSLKWYPKVKKKENKITNRITQIFRLKVLNTGEEKILYDETLTGYDHNDNELEFYHRVGKWEKPVFTKQYDEETDEVVSKEIRRHETQYDIPYSPEKIIDLAAQGPPDTLALSIDTGSRKYGGIGIFMVDEFAYMPFDALLEIGRLGKTDVKLEIPSAQPSKPKAKA